MNMLSTGICWKWNLLHVWSRITNILTLKIVCSGWNLPLVHLRSMSMNMLKIRYGVFVWLTFRLWTISTPHAPINCE